MLDCLLINIFEILFQSVICKSEVLLKIHEYKATEDIW